MLGLVLRSRLPRLLNFSRSYFSQRSSSATLECGGLTPLCSIRRPITKRRQAAALQGGSAEFVAMIVVAYLPYLSVGPKAVLGFLPGYASEQGLVSGEQFYLLSLARKVFGEGVPSFTFVIFATILWLRSQAG